MTKQEFIQELSECLLNEVDSQEYHNSVEYYSRYIDEEVRKGKTEQQVTQQLGSPRLIAKTIIDAQIGNEVSKNYNTIYDEDGYEEYENTKKQEEFKTSPFHIYFGGRELKWYEKLGAVAIFIVVLLLLLAVLGVAFSILINVVLPVIVVVLIFRLIYSFFRK